MKKEFKNVKELLNAVNSMFEIWDIAIYENQQDCRYASYDYAKDAIKAFGDVKIRSWKIESRGRRVRVNIIINA